MTLDGAHFDELVSDLEHAVDEFLAPFERDPALWHRARRGRWSAGRHAEHVARALELPLPRFEEGLRRLRQGTLAPRPGRGPLQALFIAVVVRGGKMPRGGKAIAATTPGPSPVPAVVTPPLRAAPSRYRALGSGLEPEERDRLWIPNPFISLRWHYSLPEMVRIQAVHVRHHGAQVLELRGH